MSFCKEGELLQESLKKLLEESVDEIRQKTSRGCFEGKSIRIPGAMLKNLSKIFE